jgi:1,4-dihydroxy-2-naphthoate polyprenyltransferase
MSAIQPGSWRAWLLATRPPTLFAAVVPVLIGAACAHVGGSVRWAPTLGALLGALLLQIAANFANDVFDFEKGADTGERLGPTRAVQAGLLSPAQVRRGLWLIIALSVLAGLYLTWEGGWPFLVIGLTSILAAVAYTGGPYPLGYNGLGDLFVMIFFGFVAVCGTTLLSLGKVPEVAWWSAWPAGALATAILVVNNLRDRATDLVAGKRTLAVRFGRSFTLAEYFFLVLSSFAVPLVLWLRLNFGPAIVLPFLAAPMAWLLSRQVARRQGRELNPVLVGTARLLMVFGALLALGLVLGKP